MSCTSFGVYDWFEFQILNFVVRRLSHDIELLAWDGLQVGY